MYKFLVYYKITTYLYNRCRIKISLGSDDVECLEQFK